MKNLTEKIKDTNFEVKDSISGYASYCIEDGISDIRVRIADRVKNQVFGYIRGKINKKAVSSVWLQVRREFR